MSEYLEIIERQKKRIKEVIESCELFMQEKANSDCNDECPAYRYCWELQDKEDKLGEGFKKSLEG